MRLSAILPALDPDQPQVPGSPNLPWERVVEGVTWEAAGTTVHMVRIHCNEESERSGRTTTVENRAILLRSCSSRSIVQPVRCAAARGASGWRDATDNEAPGHSEEPIDSGVTVDPSSASFYAPGSPTAYPFPSLHAVPLPWDGLYRSGNTVVPRVDRLARVIVTVDGVLRRLFLGFGLQRDPASAIMGSPLPLRLVARGDAKPSASAAGATASGGTESRPSRLMPLLIVEGRGASIPIEPNVASLPSPDRFGFAELRIPALRFLSDAVAARLNSNDPASRSDRRTAQRPLADLFLTDRDLDSSSLALWRLGSPLASSALLVSDPRRLPPDVSLESDLGAWLLAGPLQRALPSIPALCSALLLLGGKPNGPSVAERKRTIASSTVVLSTTVFLGGCFDFSQHSIGTFDASYGPLGGVSALVCLGAALLLLSCVRASSRLALAACTRWRETPAQWNDDCPVSEARVALIPAPAVRLQFRFRLLACVSLLFACIAARVHPGFFALISLPTAAAMSGSHHACTSGTFLFVWPLALVALGRALSDRAAPVSLFDAVTHALLCVEPFLGNRGAEVAPGRASRTRISLFAISCAVAFAAVAGAPWAAVPAVSVGVSFVALVS